MDKKEILAKNKALNRKSLDEREQRVYRSSFGFGAVVVGFQHNTFYEYVTIITAYLCTTFLYQYKNIRKPLYLLAGIGSGLAALLCAALFLWVNWP